MLTYQARSSLPIVRFADLPRRVPPSSCASCLSLTPSSRSCDFWQKKNLNRKAQILFVYGRNNRPLSLFFRVGRDSLLSRVAFSIPTPRFSTRKSCQLVSTSLPSEYFCKAKAHSRPLRLQVIRSDRERLRHLSPHSDVVPTSALQLNGSYSYEQQLRKIVGRLNRQALEVGYRIKFGNHPLNQCGGLASYPFIFLGAGDEVNLYFLNLRDLEFFPFCLQRSTMVL